jgi:hypothetical protein
MEFIFNENARYEGRVFKKGDKLSMVFVPLKMRLFLRSGIVSVIKAKMEVPAPVVVEAKKTSAPESVPAPVQAQQKKGFFNKGKR